MASAIETTGYQIETENYPIIIPFDKQTSQIEATKRKLKNKARNDWYKNKRLEMIEARGCKCEICNEQKAPSQLQFHHKKQCFQGKGRGRNKRILEVYKNPELFTLLCLECHNNIPVQNLDD